MAQVTDQFTLDSAPLALTTDAAAAAHEATAPAALKTTTPALHETTDAAAAAQAARAAERKALQQRRCGHATDGSSSLFYEVGSGREALPVAPQAVRAKACSQYPLQARQVTSLRKYLRTEMDYEVITPEGIHLTLKMKPSTRDEALTLSFLTELLKASARAPLCEWLHHLSISPAGLRPEDHQMVRMLIASTGPTSLMAWAQDHDLQVYQAAAQEIATTWDDPHAANLLCCEGEVPAKPNAAAVKPYIQALSERAARWPENLRPLLADLIKVALECLPSKQHDYLVTLQHLLQLSSQGLYEALLTLGQSLPKGCALAALLQPEAWTQSGANLHTFLAATKIQLKTKRARKATSKKSRSKVAATPNAIETAAPTASEPERLEATETSIDAVPTASEPECLEAAEANFDAVPTASEPECLEAAEADFDAAPTASEPERLEFAEAPAIIERDNFESAADEVEVLATSEAVRGESEASSGATAVYPAEVMGSSDEAKSAFTVSSFALAVDKAMAEPARYGLVAELTEAEGLIPDGADTVDEGAQLGRAVRRCASSQFIRTELHPSKPESARAHQERQQQRKLQRKQRKQARRHHK